MTFQILVYCDGRKMRDTGQPSHPEKCAKVSRLEWVDAGEDNSAIPGTLPIQAEATWTPHMYSRRRFDSQRSAGVEGAEPSTLEFISSEGRQVDETSELVSETHMKFLFHCNLCGQDYQRRAEDVTPALDKLRQNGVNEISLRDLGAILGSR